MAQLDPVTEQILRWAKRAARADNRNALTALDVLCGACAVLSGELSPSDAKPITQVIGESPVWSEDIVQLLERAKQVPEKDERLPLDGVLRQAVQEVFAQDPKLPSNLLLSAILAQRADPAVAAWLQNNKVVAKAIVSPVFRFLEDLRTRVQTLEQRLSEEVLGQENAIQMLVNAYWEACLGRKSEGPRGIFTFLGPPGVGKTLLAERFAAVLQEIEGERVAFRRFDMGSFAGPQNFEQLFGAEGFYKAARPGTLTGFVAENPRAVILLDEIEKAHETTLNALLSVLDKGQVTDKNLQEEVSFRECWFIFTTNLGREFFERSNTVGILGSGRDARGFVFEILASARRRRETGVDDAPPALPLELVSRMAKGGAVLFRELTASTYLQLLRQTIKRENAALREATSLPFADISVDDDSAILFLMSLLPKLDARQVVARAGGWAAELRKSAYEQYREHLLESGSHSFAIHVTCAKDASTYLSQRYSALKLQVVLVDDDEYLLSYLQASVGPYCGQVHRAVSEKDAVDMVQRVGADVVLLDLSIQEPPNSAGGETGLRILKSIRTRFPEVPVWLFSENPEARAEFSKVVHRAIKQGGARGFVPCHYERENSVLRDEFLAHVDGIVRDAARHKVLWQLRRAHKTLTFDTEFRLGDDGEVEASITRVQEGTVVSATDQTAPIGFSGIPTERFSSVVGLHRAKRRLAQVVAWLRDPSALASFGISPPRGFLLAGPPGTGKTLLAKAVAGEAGLPFLGLSAGELQSKWYGETEERIRLLFRLAREYAPSIVFIDEIDAIGGQRHALDPVRQGVIDQLLASMDGLGPVSRPVFVLAATNHPDQIDPALRRPGRFDEVIPIDLPNAEARRNFFELFLARVPISGAIDVKLLVELTPGLSPAELDRVVREAAYGAAVEGRPGVTQEDLLAAIRLVRFGAASEEMVLQPEERRLVAFHEAGHAVAHLSLFPDHPIDYLTIIPSESGALGFVGLSVDERRHRLTRRDVKRKLVVYLAGREAERMGAVSSDEVSTGAASDLESASALAWRAVTQWGLDEEFGPLVLSQCPPEARSNLAAQAGERVQAWLNGAQKRAIQILQQNRSLLEELANHLLEKEALERESIQKLLEKRAR